MASNMRTSQAGLDVIKAFEGFRPRYQKLPDGRWIIGYGHVRSERERVDISEPEAEAILRAYDLPPYERLVMDAVLAPLNQNEFDALVSFAFNIGAKAFVSSDVVARINAGNRLEAAQAFDAWRRARIGGREQVIDALVRRRACEKALFLKSPGAYPTATSRLYRPLPDSQYLLPAPTTRDVVVESKGSVVAAPTPPESQSARTATEEAAESVRRRLVRIIGEDEVTETIAPEMTDGASPEEITAAISALAGEVETGGVHKSVWPAQDDLPAPPYAKDETDEESQDQAVDRIDDLEEVTVSPEDIARAVAINRQMEAHARGMNGLAAVPFGLLAVIGGVLAGFGLKLQFFPDLAAVGSGQASLSDYLPLFLIVLGGLMFIVMAYYFVRALVSPSD